MLIIICLRVVFGGHSPTPRRSYRVAPRKRAGTYCSRVEGAPSGKALLPFHAMQFSEVQRKINVFGVF